MTAAMPTIDLAVARRPNTHFRSGITAADRDNETGTFEAYVEFAFHRTAHDAEVYENAAMDSPIGDQKNFFVQLACLKNEAADTLKMYRSDFSYLHDAERKHPASSPAREGRESETGSLATMNGALNFAYQRESRTLALYEKLAKTAHLSTVRILFDYLLESQRHQILYLATQCAAVNCTLL